MNTPHSLTVSEGTVTPSGCILRSWCTCGRQFAARAETFDLASGMIRSRLRDHRGHEGAEGPGGRMQ